MKRLAFFVVCVSVSLLLLMFGDAFYNAFTLGGELRWALAAYSMFLLTVLLFFVVRWYRDIKKLRRMFGG